MDELRIWKYHGTGNDFVLIEDVADRIRIDEELARRLCDRRFGIGADGVIRVAPAEDADFFMDHRNADGSLAQMCGNGIRCLGKLVFDRGLTDRTEIEVGTCSGVKLLSLHVTDGSVASVTVAMGRARFELGALPMRGDPCSTFIGEPFAVDGRSYKGTALSMGNPHLVLFVEEDPDDLDVARIGPLVELDERFPERTNVEFVAVQGAGVKVRVWERGVGETMACGTGACAAVVAANEAGLVPTRAPARFPGGVLEIERGGDDEISLTGPAVRVLEGTLDPVWLAAGGAGNSESEGERASVPPSGT
jgi:diaminopimelate epimerase